MYESVVNDMSVSVDWMSFTVTDPAFNVFAVIEFLGFDTGLFCDTGHGAMGYRSLHKMADYAVSVLSDGRDDMGIHVTISGSAVAHVLQRFWVSQYCFDNPFNDDKTADWDVVCMDALRLFFLKVLEIGRFTRVDLALDDHKVHFTPADIRGYIESGQVVSKFRSGRREEGFDLASNAPIGDTLYLGSRKSDVMLRIYDKQLEQALKHPADPVTVPWVRWEFEFTAKRADQLAYEIVKHESLGMLFFKLLNNYVRLIVLSDSNRSRCPMLPAWSAFIACIDALTLYCPPVERTLDDKRNWVIKQVLPTLTGIIIADGGTFDLIMDNWDRSVDRMSESMRRLISGVGKNNMGGV